MTCSPVITTIAIIVMPNKICKLTNPISNPKTILEAFTYIVL